MGRYSYLVEQQGKSNTTNSEERKDKEISFVDHQEKRSSDTVIPRYHDTTIPSEETEEQMYEAVRKAVKQVGKEPATQRLTLEEKQALMDIEYSYKRQGVRTSGNEIIRIATNYIIREHKKNGDKSILAKILEKINS